MKLDRTCSLHQIPGIRKKFEKMPTILILFDIATHFSQTSRNFFHPWKTFPKFFIYGEVSLQEKIFLRINLNSWLYKTSEAYIIFFLSWYWFSVFSVTTGLISSINHPIECSTIVREYLSGKSIFLLLV